MQIPYAELDQTNDESISMVFLMLPKFWSSIAAKCQNVLLQNLTFSLLSWEIFSFKFAFGFLEFIRNDCLFAFRLVKSNKVKTVTKAVCIAE